MQILASTHSAIYKWKRVRARLSYGRDSVSVCRCTWNMNVACLPFAGVESPINLAQASFVNWSDHLVVRLVWDFVCDLCLFHVIPCMKACEQWTHATIANLCVFHAKRNSHKKSISNIDFRFVWSEWDSYWGKHYRFIRLRALRRMCVGVKWAVRYFIVMSVSQMSDLFSKFTISRPKWRNSLKKLIPENKLTNIFEIWDSILLRGRAFAFVTARMSRWRGTLKIR